MRNSPLAFTLLACAALTVSPNEAAHAADAPAEAVPAAISARMSPDIYRREAERRMLNYDRDLDPDCKDRRVADHGAAREIEDPQIRAQKPHAVLAVLEQIMTIRACGENKQYRFWVYVPAPRNEKPVFIYAMPGESLTWPLIHGSAWRLVSGLAASDASAECRKMAESGMTAPLAVGASLGDVYEPLAPATDMDVYLEGAWGETWTLRLCGRERSYDLMFLADSGGGGYVTTVDGAPDEALADLKEARDGAERVIAVEPAPPAE